MVSIESLAYPLTPKQCSRREERGCLLGVMFQEIGKSFQAVVPHIDTHPAESSPSSVYNLLRARHEKKEKHDESLLNGNQ